VNIPTVRHVLGVLLALAMLAGAMPLNAQTEPPLIRVGASADDGARPMLYAVQAGLYKKAGLNVEVQKLANRAAIAAAVAGGSLEIGKDTTLTEVVEHSKGLPFSTIANLQYYSADAPEA
jgi:ABC-type nitrate/sulfonate/bicarbonate transport system substrate-binding protein